MIYASPDLVTVTLGANGIAGLLFDPQRCLLRPACVQAEVQKAQTEVRLVEVLKRLLAARRAKILVTHYHDLPADPGGVISFLNATIDAAVRGANDSRVRVVELPTFLGHGCSVPGTSWLQRTDCLHPNPTGVQRYADAVLTGYRDQSAATTPNAVVKGLDAIINAVLRPLGTVEFRVIAINSASVLGGRVRAILSPPRGRASSAAPHRVTVHFRPRFRDGAATVKVALPGALRRRRVAGVVVQLSRAALSCKPPRGRCPGRWGPQLRIPLDR